jgi:hypothetical protein
VRDAAHGVRRSREQHEDENEQQRADHVPTDCTMNVA